MSIDKRVSTDGLTRCTRCRRHVRAGESPSTTACPFCERKAPTARRGALLASSLFAMACGGATPPAEEPATEPVPVEQPVEPIDYEPEPEAETEPEEETGAEIEPGDETETDPEVATPEDPEPEDPDAFERPVDRPGVVALYGIAPRK